MVESLKASNSDLNSTNEIILSWIKPNGGNAISRYLIEWYQYRRNYRYYRHGHYYRDEYPYLNGNKYVSHVLGKINYNSTISNLQSGTKYQFRVYAVNAMGHYSYRSTYIATGK